MSKGVVFRINNIIKENKKRTRSMLILIVIMLLAFSLLGCSDSSDEVEKNQVTTESKVEESKKNDETVKETETEEVVKYDYEDAESFEQALISGEDTVGKKVRFSIREVHSDTSLGCNLWAGKHLNFYSHNIPDVQKGDEIGVIIKFVYDDKSFDDGVSRWLINYKIIGEEDIDDNNGLLEKYAGVYKWTYHASDEEINKRMDNFIKILNDNGRTIYIELFKNGEYLLQTTYNNSQIRGNWNLERIEVQGETYLCGFVNDEFTICDRGEKLVMNFEEDKIPFSQYIKTSYDDIVAIKNKLPKVKVPDFSKYTKNKAKKWCKKNGVKCIIEEEYSDTVESGKMISQSKAAGLNVYTLESLNQEIIIKYSLGRKPVIYEGGTYKVGKDIDPGEYIIFADDAYGASVCISSDANSTFENTIYLEYFGNNQIVTVKKGDYIKIEDSYMYSFEEALKGGIDGKSIEELMEYRIEEGVMYKVGVNLKPGEYKLKCTDDSGSWKIYKNIRKRFGNEFDYFEGSAYVKVEKGDYLLLDDCVIVTE